MKSIGLPYENEKWFREILNDPNFVYNHFNYPENMRFGTLWKTFEGLYNEALSNYNNAKSTLDYYNEVVDLINKINSYVKRFNELHVLIYQKNPDGTKNYQKSEAEVVGEELNCINEVMEDRTKAIKELDSTDKALKSMSYLKEWLENYDVLIHLYYCLAKCDRKYVNKTERMIKKYIASCTTLYNTLKKDAEIEKLMHSENGGIWMAIRIFSDGIINQGKNLIKLSHKPNNNYKLLKEKEVK